jgi:hypothetical protein
LDFSPSNRFGPASSLPFQPSRGPPPPSLSGLACPRLPLTDRWAHPVSEPGRLLPPEARPGATAAISPACSRRLDDPSSPKNGAAFPLPFHSPLTPPFPSHNRRIEGLEGAPPPLAVPFTAPPPLPSSGPIKGAPSTASPHRTSSHSLFRLSVPPLTPHRAPTRHRYGSPSPASSGTAPSTLTHGRNPLRFPLHFPPPPASFRSPGRP